MTFKCIESTYAKRLFEKGVTYPSIGSANPKYFVEVGGSSKGTAPAGGGSSPSGERGEIMAALDELGVEFSKNTSTEKLKARLLKAQQEALQS